MKKALIMVDLQNDFCPGGSLAVNQGNEIIALANQLQQQFDRVIATQDWHPKDHLSFASNHQDKVVGDIININGFEQMLWPNHCVQHSHGAEFCADLETQKINKIIYKGVNINVDSYSAFFDNSRLVKTELHCYLQEQEINTIYIMGLATDYCVKFTALDAAELQFNTYLITDACRGVELKSGDTQQAFQEMHNAGVKLIHSSALAL